MINMVEFNRNESPVAGLKTNLACSLYETWYREDRWPVWDKRSLMRVTTLRRIPFCGSNGVPSDL